MLAEDKVRLFAALQLPDGWLAALSRIRASLETVAANELRWVRPELMHVTLLFLGYQPAERLPEIEAALGTAATEGRPFRLSLDSLGTFGPPQGITVLWAGLTEVPPPLAQLHQVLALHLTEQKVVFDRTPLVPHITLARGKRPIDREVSLRVASALKQLDMPRGLATSVDAFVLMRSRLSPRGPTYEVLRSFRLGGAGDV